MGDWPEPEGDPRTDRRLQLEAWFVGVLVAIAIASGIWSLYRGG